MSLALPGWIDTGDTQSISTGGSMSVTMDHAGGTSKVNINGFELSVVGHSVADQSCGGPPTGYTGDFTVTLTGPPGTPGSPATVGTEHFHCVSVSYTKTGTESYSGTAGPYRLGYRVNTVVTSPHPLFPTIHYELEYTWFADENTQNVETCGPFSITRYMQPTGSWGFSPATGMTPINVGQIGSLGFSCNIAPPGSATWSGLSITGGSIDTTGLLDGVIMGDGGGAAHTYNPGISGHGVSPGLNFTEDIDISRFGGSSTGATIRDADGNAHTVPYSGAYSTINQDWSTPSSISSGRGFTIDSTWAAAQTVPFRTDDLNVRLDMAPKAKGGGSYLPISIDIAPSLSLHRPDGDRPSDWTSSDGTKIGVSEGTDSVFSVSASGAHVTRTLLSAWKTRCGVVGGVVSFPSYQYTKHLGPPHVLTTEDIYSLETYAYAKLTINAPATGDLTLTLIGNYLSVTDPHTTGSGRSTAYLAAVALVPITLTWTLPVTAGTHDYEIDLLFPNEGGITYPPRVNSWQLSGFVPGTVLLPNVYTLSDFSLIAKGDAHLKIDFGPPVPGQDYSCIGLSLDGSWVFGNIPDQLDKPDEIGQYGGDNRYVDPLTGDPSGETLDQHFSLSDFATQLDNIEGVTATYDATATDGFFKDVFGNGFGDLAQFIQPVIPHHTFTPGVGYSPPCSLPCKRVIITNAASFTIYSRWNAGYGGIEVLAKSGGGRAPAGTSVTIGGVSGTTDAYGYTIISPLPANGAVAYTDGTSTLYLRPHDLPRLLETVPGTPQPGIDLARLPVSWMCRAWLKDVSSVQTVKVGRTLDAGGSWADHDVATDANAGAVPTILAHRSGTLFAFYHDASDHTRIWCSPLAEPTAWVNCSTLATVGRFPRGAFMSNDDLMIAHYRSGGVVISRSRDFGTSATDINTADFTGLPEQLVGLRCDRHGILHLCWVDSTPQIIHSYSRDGITWSTPEVLNPGDHPSFAQGIERAVVLRWVSTTPHGEFTNEDYGGSSAIPAFDLTGLSSPGVQYLGLEWDAGERVWMAELDGSGDPQVFYSPDRHTLTGL